MDKLSGKTVVVTGGGRGIGQAIALACAEKGANVAVLARSKNELAETEKLLKTKGAPKVAALPCDVSDREAVASAIGAVADRLGPVYGLVCAAGIYGPMGPFEDNSLEEWEKTIAINVMGTVYCAHAVIPAMKKAGKGRIITLSGGGEGAYQRFSSYVTSKGAIWRLTETLGAELAPFGIYVNSIAPGAVNTRLLDDLLAAGPGVVGEETYKKSLAQKEAGGVSATQGAEMALYLLSEKSKGLYGKVLSAVWDKIEEFKDLEALSKSSQFNMRRVVPK